jgi:hypothetical protein
MAQMLPFVPIPKPKPAQSARQAGTPQPEEGSDLKSEWKTFLDQPENRAALLQFGISMLNPQGGNLGANIGTAIGQGAEARDRALAGQAEQAAAVQKGRESEALIAQRLATAGKASRQARGPGGSSGAGATTATKDMTPKELTKEWIKFAKDKRELDPDAPIADIRAEFDAIIGASAPAPAAAGNMDISVLTLDQLNALDVGTLSPEQLAAASARYKALKQAK